MNENSVAQKMTFRSFTENTCKEKNFISEYVVMMNPANLTRTLASKNAKTQSAGMAGSDGKWVGLESESFKFDLIFDGTGLVNPYRTDVKAEIEEFLKVVYLSNKKDGRQVYVEISYGSYTINCKMSSMNIDYQLFNRSGDPIRAKLSCTFTTVSIPKERKKTEGKKNTQQATCCPCPPENCCSVVQQAQEDDSDTLMSKM